MNPVRRVLAPAATPLLAACAFAGLVGLPASAQSLDDIENAVTRGNVFNDAATNDRRQAGQSLASEEIDGEAGVYVLQRNKIFSVSAVAGAGYSDNPGRTLDINSEASPSVDFAIAAAADTRVARQLDMGANLVLSGVEYTEDGAPDSRNLVANTYVGRDFFDGAFYGSVSASYGQAMDGRFDNGTAFYGATASLTTVRPLTSNLLVQPELTVSRQWSDVSEQDNTAASLGAKLLWAPYPKWKVSASVEYTYRIYDDFFEDVTFVERTDDVIRVGLGAARKLGDNLSLSASVTYTDQSSEFFLSEYTSFDGGVSLRLSQKF